MREGPRLGPLFFSPALYAGDSDVVPEASFRFFGREAVHCFGIDYLRVCEWHHETATSDMSFFVCGEQVDAVFVKFGVSHYMNSLCSWIEMMSYKMIVWSFIIFVQSFLRRCSVFVAPMAFVWYVIFPFRRLHWYLMQYILSAIAPPS